MEKEINSFITYLHNVKKMSLNTELSYRRDLAKVERFMNEQGITDPSKITSKDLNSYIL